MLSDPVMCGMPGYDMQRRQNDTLYPIGFQLRKSVDHYTPATGAAPVLAVSKNGGALAAPSGPVIELGSGQYSWQVNATDMNTDGEMNVTVTGTGADAVFLRIWVLPNTSFSLNQIGQNPVNTGVFVAGP